MSAYATKAGEAFAAKVLERFYQEAVTDKITNSDYEGEIKNKTSKVNIGTLGALSLRQYTGAPISWDDLTESVGQLATDQAYYSAFKVDSMDEFISFIKNPENTALTELVKVLKERIDLNTLALWPDVAAGQRDGTVFDTGTVTVDVTTGVVTHSGTGFTAAMAGKPFKALGHTKWYRVKHYTSTSQIEIEDDVDDVVSAYTGGAIAGGATFQIQALTAVQVTAANIRSRLLALKTFLDKAKIPQMGRFFVGPADIINLMPLATEGAAVVDAGTFEEMQKRGYVGRSEGFNIYSNEQVAGDAVNGYHCLAGVPSAITFALGFTQSDVFPKLEGTFGRGYKGLNIWGHKVLDERRKALAEGFWKL